MNNSIIRSKNLQNDISSQNYPSAVVVLYIMGAQPSTSNEKANKPSILISTPKVLKRISECVLPYDLEAVTDYLELLEFNLNNPITTYFSNMLFLKNHGINIIFQIMKSTDDETCMRLVFSILETQLENTAAMRILLQLGGLGYICHIESTYKEYPALFALLMKIKRAVIDAGSTIAMKEILYQTDMLRLCEPCQAIIDKQTQNNRKNKRSMVVAQSANERVNRILVFIDVYLLKYQLQCVALDALLIFVERGNMDQIFKSKEMIITIGKTFNEYVFTKAGIIWRVCRVLQKLAELHKELAKEVALLSIHNTLCTQYPRLGKRPQIQQTILRLLAALAKWEANDLSRLILQQSAPCMQLLISIEDENKEARKRKRRDLTLTIEPALIDGSRYTHFAVMLPLALRTFLRENGRQTLAVQTETEVVIKPRNSAYDKSKILKPLYGTIADMYFVPGEEGLV